jgi:hypothetical protein
VTGRRLAAFAVALAALAVFGFAYRELWSFLIDDVFISLRYARHLGQGQGLVWNPGERVEGYTNFLWTVLLVPGFRVPFGVVQWVKVLNAVWALAAFALTWRLAARVDAASPGNAGRADPLWSVLPAAATVISLPFVLGAGEGLETVMFAALALLATLFAWDARESDRLPRTALALTALAMTRPEGVLCAPWLLAVQRQRGRSWRFVAREAAAFALLFGAYFAGRWAWYGDLLPNTFYAKSGGDPMLFARGWEEVAHFFASNGGWVWLLALPALFAPRWRGAAFAVAGVPVLRALFILWSGGAWMGRDRFLVPAVPFLFILLAMGARVAVRRAGTVATAIVLLIALVGGWLRWPPERDRALGYGHGLRAAHARLGADVNAHTRTDAVLAMDDAGIGPLIADRTTVDMLGLNDRHIAHLPGRFADKYDVGYVLGRRPDLVVLIAATPPDSAPAFRLAGHLALYQASAFRDSFEFSRDYLFGPNYWLRVYRRRDGARVDTSFWTLPASHPGPR